MIDVKRFGLVLVLVLASLASAQAQTKQELKGQQAAERSQDAQLKSNYQALQQQNAKCKQMTGADRAACNEQVKAGMASFRQQNAALKAQRSATDKAVAANKAPNGKGPATTAPSP